MLSYKILTLGQLSTNCYLVWDKETKETLIVDPADDGEFIANECLLMGLKVKSIGLTHGHSDHLLGAITLSLIYQKAIAYSFLDKFLTQKKYGLAGYKNEVDLNLVKEINLGQEKIEIIKLPGHTPGSLGFYYQKQNWIISGDTVFADGVGGYDHKYSNKNDLFLSVRKIKELKDVLILPGHSESTYLPDF